MHFVGPRIDLLAILLTLVVSSSAQQTRQGLKPRNLPSEYPAVHEEQNAVFGAEQLSQEQMKHALSTELYGRYIVVEIGVFPAAGSEVSVWPEDFVLRNDANGQMLRAVDPATVARVNQKDPVHKHETNLQPYGNVGYSSTAVDANGRRTGGWHGGAGSAVWVDKNPVGGTADDREELEAELLAKEIPSGDTVKPVAGYLYFPVPTKTNKRTKYELHYSRGGQIFTLPLPGPTKK